MRKLTCGICLLVFLISACSDPDKRPLKAFDVYCEMVSSEAKPIALHYPMDSKAIDQLWSNFQKIADKHQVQLYREDNFPNTLLFPEELTKGKTVILIHKGDRLTQYKQLKKDLLADDGSEIMRLTSLSRRFGRLLGYSSQGINNLLAKNSAYRNLEATKVMQQITHLYYENIEKAIAFYGETLGLKKTDDAIFQISDDSFIKINPLNDEHPKGQSKSTAIALLTNQLAGWYAYLQEKNVDIKYTYKPREGGPHDGFVAIDPEGYLLEFEQFKQHPENELFMAKLASAASVKTSVKNLDFYGSITWTYHKDLLLMQNFYEQVLGYQLVADQGWTKIYQTSDTGFIGLVDERRGMEDYADAKAVEIEWRISDNSQLQDYASKHWLDYAYDGKSLTGPEKYRYQIADYK